MAVSDEPDVDALVGYVNAATERWAPDLRPLERASLVEIFDRAAVFDVRTRRRPRRALAAIGARIRDCAIPRREAGASLVELDDAVLRRAVADADELVARHGASLPGLDVGVTAGMTDRGVRTWGVHAFEMAGARPREHWELLAYRRPGVSAWTIVQSAESARTRTDEVLLRWATRQVG